MAKDQEYVITLDEQTTQEVIALFNFYALDPSFPSYSSPEALVIDALKTQLERENAKNSRNT